MAVDAVQSGMHSGKVPRPLLNRYDSIRWERADNCLQHGNTRFGILAFWVGLKPYDHRVLHYEQRCPPGDIKRRLYVLHLVFRTGTHNDSVNECHAATLNIHICAGAFMKQVVAVRAISSGWNGYEGKKRDCENDLQVLLLKQLGCNGPW